MAAFKPLTEEQVTFTWELEADDLDPAGHLMSGDPAYEAEDKARIVEIRDRLQRGDERAWCWVRVTATDADGNEGSDSLGGIELGTDAGWGDQLEAHVRATFPDIWSEALASLNEARRAKHTPKVVRMCKTEASRDRNGNTWVRARHVTTNKMKRMPWDDGLDEFENHAAVAEVVLGGRPQFSASLDGGGYMFGLGPATVKP